MSRVTETFARLKSAGRTAFMPYLVAGDPDLETSKRLVLALEEAGADLIELGVPFSDPLADGPTNQLAAARALRGGTTLRKVIGLVEELRASTAVPILLMGYYNPFLRYGLEALCRDAAAAGADGLIIPDLQPDDAGEIRGAADRYGLDTVFLIAPTSPPSRLAAVARESRGFVYAVSLTGVTGERQSLPDALSDFIKSARERIDLPLAVGFGISTPEMVRAVATIADGVIVGSAIVKRIGKATAEGTDPVPPVREFVRSLAQMLS